MAAFLLGGIEEIVSLPVSLLKAIEEITITPSQCPNAASFCLQREQWFISLDLSSVTLFLTILLHSFPVKDTMMHCAPQNNTE